MEVIIYSEEDVREAFKAGAIKGGHQSYFDAPLDEDEFVAELKAEKIKKSVVTITEKIHGSNYNYPYKA